MQPPNAPRAPGRKRGDDPSICGLLVADKPTGMTSHDVVDAARRILGVRRIGHTGILDPLATGVLPLCVGRATRLAQYLLAESKTYEGFIRLGCCSMKRLYSCCWRRHSLRYSLTGEMARTPK